LDHHRTERELSVDLAGGVVVDGDHTWAVRTLGNRDRAGARLLQIDGSRQRFVIEIADCSVDVSHQGRFLTFGRPTGRAQLAAATSDGEIVAPMPGVITVIATEVGKQVTTGDALGVMEAMKMEHALTSPVDGVVTAVAVELGEQVIVGQPLFTIAANTDAEPHIAEA
jgi:3-methylcrotonyl-CoA carboxylase alpha subunit/acetyl-CoA/propionyl-CoA carboxylase biotin carboxyl carrier protein